MKGIFSRELGKKSVQFLELDREQHHGVGGIEERRGAKDGHVRQSRNAPVGNENLGHAVKHSGNGEREDDQKAVLYIYVRDNQLSPHSARTPPSLCVVEDCTDLLGAHFLGSRSEAEGDTDKSLLVGIPCRAE